MKKLTLIFNFFNFFRIFLLISFISNGANIYAQSKAFIPDINFRNFLNTTYPGFIVGDSLLTDSAATITGTLSCSNENIADITGLEWFINIQWLYCYDNLLTSLPDLSAFTSLKLLHCYDNLLTSLPDLSPHTALQKLFCYNNQLTSLPGLSTNMLLQRLYCYDNQLTSLPDLSNNFLLERLYCYNNQLTSLPDLSSNTDLETLWCTNNLLTTLPDLSSNTALTIISCDQNQLTSLPDLSTLTALEDIYCYSNQLTVLPDFSANTALTMLCCNNNLLTNLPDLSTNTALEMMFCNDNKLDFSDARELRIVNNLPALTNYSYAPQKPFGDSAAYTFYEGDSVALSISSQDSALSYQWFRGIDAIVGATDTILIIPNITLADSGIYTCRSYGTALLFPPMLFGPGISEFVSESLTVTVTPAVGIVDNQLDIDLEVYPNPAKNNITLDLGANFNKITLTILNVNGQIIETYSYRQKQMISMNIENYATGLYLFKVEADNKEAIIRVLK